MGERVKSVVMTALKNKDDDEPTYTGTGCALLSLYKIHFLS
jgi:hypothetical protein